MQHTDMPTREKSVFAPGTDPPERERLPADTVPTEEGSVVPLPTAEPPIADIPLEIASDLPENTSDSNDSLYISTIPEEQAKQPTPQPADVATACVSDKGARIFPVLSFLLRAFCLFLCVLGGAVYLCSAYFHGSDALSGGTALSDALSRLVLGEIAGGADRITVRTSTASQADTPDAGSARLSGIPELSVQSAHANEAESGMETYTPSEKERLCEDLSSRSENGLGLVNETPYQPSLAALADSPLSIEPLWKLQEVYGEDAPVCLILHTHGTEGFLDSAGTGFHTADKEKSVIRLGALMADVLTENGIPVIHCETAFDENRFDSAYYNASLYIRETLAAYPSIRYIFDIHRDAIEWTGASGKVHGVAPVLEENGNSAAQLMFVVGTDHGGSGHSGWQDNLSLAAHLQKSLTKAHPGLCRDINLRSASFNEQYTKGSLLIEAGAASSTMEEASQAIRWMAEALAEAIVGDS